MRGHGVEVTHNVERKAITNSLSRAVEDHAFHDFWDLLTQPGSTSRDPSLKGEEIEQFQQGKIINTLVDIMRVDGQQQMVCDFLESMPQSNLPESGA